MKNNRKTTMRALAAIVAVSAVISATTMTASAAGTSTTDSGAGNASGTVTMNGTIEPLDVSITHLVNASYAIDPNTNTFTTPALSITNNSAAPIKVTVNSLASAPASGAGDSIQFTDVLPDAKSWSSIDAADSKKYIALGIKITDPSGWDSGYNTGIDYAAANTPVTFGSIQPSATANLQMVANFGRAIDKAYTASHNIVFRFDLA